MFIGLLDKKNDNLKNLNIAKFNEIGQLVFFGLKLSESYDRQWDNTIKLDRTLTSMIDKLEFELDK